MSAPRIFPPGSTIGVMGSGQLGRMFTQAAHRMGYKVQTFSPERNSPMGQIADVEVLGSYDDETAVRKFAQGVNVLTFEFENIPAKSVQWAAEHCDVRPAGSVLHVCQHRLREKQFLSSAGLPLPKFIQINSEAHLRASAAVFGMNCVLKTAAFGYDGKGQQRITAETDIAAVWSSFQGQPAVLEAWVPFEKEISVLVARGVDGRMVSYPVCENIHSRHILDITICPGNIPHESAVKARAIAGQVAEALDLVGLLAVEMFLLPDGEVLINELAPRPHNSGHYSFDASVTSQFEQQLRAVCGLPLGSTESLKPAAMANLLGDLWENGEPNWIAALQMPDVKLHLYGKAEARPGRKMGHLVAFGGDAAAAGSRAREARERLTRRAL